MFTWNNILFADASLEKNINLSLIFVVINVDAITLWLTIVNLSRSDFVIVASAAVENLTSTIFGIFVAPLVNNS